MADQPTGTVLCVDDDADTRLTYRWIFEHAGFVVQEAATGAEALRQAQARPDVVLLDVNLPDINGFEVCRRLKAHPATRNVPVLHLSAVYVGSEDRAHGLEEGAAGYLVKPVEPHELLAQVHALLRLHEAEERARAEVRHWQATFNAVADGICLLDAKGMVLRCNQALARLLRSSPADIVGLHYGDLTPRAELQVLPFESMRANRRREVRDVALGDRWLQITADPMIEDETLAGAVYLLADVTERRQLEEQLRKAQKMEAVGRLAGGIAHDFNNLLTVILGNVDLVLAGTSTEDPAHTLLTATEKAAWRAAELVQQLLGFSRKAMLRREALDLTRCLADVIEVVRATLDPRIALETHIAADLWQVRADRGLLSQVILHLCLNACEAMPQGGRLRLDAENVTIAAGEAGASPHALEGRHVRLAIADTGAGIAPEIQAHLFEPFITTKPFGQGTGLGLAAAFGIIRQHGGWIDCQSGPGQGSRFDVYLPASGSNA
jgi:PAS domain S-box-containing protein